jgi:hypothetical protein
MIDFRLAGADQGTHAASPRAGASRRGGGRTARTTRPTEPALESAAAAEAQPRRRRRSRRRRGSAKTA